MLSHPPRKSAATVSRRRGREASTVERSLTPFYRMSRWVRVAAAAAAEKQKASRDGLLSNTAFAISRNCYRLRVCFICCLLTRTGQPKLPKSCGSNMVYKQISSWNVVQGEKNSTFWKFNGNNFLLRLSSLRRLRVLGERRWMGYSKTFSCWPLQVRHVSLALAHSICCKIIFFFTWTIGICHTWDLLCMNWQMKMSREVLLPLLGI